MLVVETIGKIRRAYFVQGRPIKAICRELNVSRKVGFAYYAGMATDDLAAIVAYLRSLPPSRI